MSRTYRKIQHWRDSVYNPDTKKWEEPTEKDIAKFKSDGGPCRHNTQWWMNQVSRKGRCVNKKQFSKLDKTLMEDLEDFDFDDSEYQRKRKGIWWEIY